MEFTFTRRELRYRPKPTEPWRIARLPSILGAVPTAAEGSFLVQSANYLYAVEFGVGKYPMPIRTAVVERDLPADYRLPDPDYSAYQIQAPPEPKLQSVEQRRKVVNIGEAARMFDGLQEVPKIDSFGDFYLFGLPYRIANWSDANVPRVFIDEVSAAKAIDEINRMPNRWQPNPATPPAPVLISQKMAERLAASSKDLFNPPPRPDVIKAVDDWIMGRTGPSSPAKPQPQKPLAIGQRRAYFAD